MVWVAKRLEVVGVESESVIAVMGKDVVDISRGRPTLHTCRMCHQEQSPQFAPSRIVSSFCGGPSSGVPFAFMLRAPR